MLSRRRTINLMHEHSSASDMCIVHDGAVQVCNSTQQVPRHESCRGSVHLVVCWSSWLQKDKSSLLALTSAALYQQSGHRTCSCIESNPDIMGLVQVGWRLQVSIQSDEIPTSSTSLSLPSLKFCFWPWELRSSKARALELARVSLGGAAQGWSVAFQGLVWRKTEAVMLNFGLAKLCGCRAPEFGQFFLKVFTINESMLGIDDRFAVPYQHAIVYDERYLLGFNYATFFSSTVP